MIAASKKKRKKYKGPLPIVDIVGSSSRYDRSLDSLEKAVEDYITQEGVNLHFGTEVSAEKRERVLKRVARKHKWAITTGDKSYRDDCYIMWSKMEWITLDKGSFQVKSGDIFTAKGSRMPDNTSQYAVLEHIRSGHRLLAVSGHPPSGVERGGSIQRSKRGLAWRVEIFSQKRQTNKLAKKHNVDGVIIRNDWNADVKKASNRATIKTIMPRWKFGVRPPYERGGTHGNRWIDFVMFRKALKLVRKAWLLPDDASSDHRPSRTRLRFTKKPRNK